MPLSHQPSRGFTLLELILVLVIIGLIAAVSGASLSRFVRHAARQDVSRDLLSLLHKARASAMQTGAAQRVVIDTVARRAWIEPHAPGLLLLDGRTTDQQPSDTVGWPITISIWGDFQAFSVDDRGSSPQRERRGTTVQETDEQFASTGDQSMDAALIGGVIAFDPLGLNPAGYLVVQDRHGAEVLMAPSVTEGFVALQSSSPWIQEVNGLAALN